MSIDFSIQHAGDVRVNENENPVNEKSLFSLTETVVKKENSWIGQR